MFDTRFPRTHHRPAAVRETPSRSIEPLSERAPAVSPHPSSIADTEPAADASRSVRRSFNEAAHKLGYWPVRPGPAAEHGAVRRAAGGGRRHPRRGRPRRPDGARARSAGHRLRRHRDQPALRRAGDLHAHANAARTTPAGVYGVVSLIFWTLMILVSIKYAGFIMRAHNRGDGGIMALTALVKRRRVPGGRARHARHLRRRTVLRRRHHHPGDLGDLGGRGPQHRRPRASPISWCRSPW